MRLGDLVIPCAVLDDGTRVISERGLGTAFGRERGGSDWRRRAESEEGGELPYFLIAKRLKPFIDSDLELVGYKRISYLTPTGGGRDGYAFGTKAELLPNICDVWLKAREAGLLNQRQRAIAAKATNQGSTLRCFPLSIWERKARRDSRVKGCYIQTETLPRRETRSLRRRRTSLADPEGPIRQRVRPFSLLRPLLDLVGEGAHPSLLALGYRRMCRPRIKHIG